MKAWGITLLIIGLFVIIASFAMDTSVPTSFGRINNIGLMKDQQNILMLGGLLFLAGILLMIFARGGVSKGVVASSSSRPDPFDRLDEEADYRRKEYAISIGVSRADGRYLVDSESFSDLEDAIERAEAARGVTAERSREGTNRLWLDEAQKGQP